MMLRFTAVQRKRLGLAADATAADVLAAVEGLLAPKPAPPPVCDVRRDLDDALYAALWPEEV